MLLFVLYRLFKTQLAEDEQVNIKTILRILFVCGQNLVKFPFIFAISFPDVVSTGPNTKSSCGNVGR